MAKLVVEIIDRFKKPKHLTDLVVFTDIRNYIPDWDTEKYLIACVKYAKQNGVFLVPTRFVTNNHVFMCVISPEGKIISVQAAVHLNLSYKGIFKASEEVSVVDIKGVKVVLAVDADIYHPEYIMHARQLGCELIVASQYIDVYEYKDEMMLRGVWNAAQTAGIYVVGCNNNTTAICAPCDITEDNSGFLLNPLPTKLTQIKIFTHKLEKSQISEFAGKAIIPKFLENHASQLIVG